MSFKAYNSFFLLMAFLCVPVIAGAQKYVVSEDEDHLRLEYLKDVKAGSALDFSGMGLLDAPAGKYGCLKVVGDHFEFENLPGVEQRFYGINLCGTTNYPSHRQTDALLQRLVMNGYNSIRLHHHDNFWEDAQNQEKLDYLLSKAIELGFYITTDLYVSRKVKWTDIGVDREGNVPDGLFKGLVGCDDAAFSNWCAYTSSFLCHVNKYTGRAYKDEPALCLISLVNENKISAAYRDEFFLQDKGMLSWWKEFCVETSLPDLDPEHPAKIWSDGYNEFSRWYQRKAFVRCSKFVKSLGCKALMTNDSNTTYAEGMGSASGFDYIDSHFYIDHPKFQKGWGLPSTLKNENAIITHEPKRLLEERSVENDIPYVATEWCYTAPNRYRGMGGLLIGALASYTSFDGLWRFTYAHSNIYIDEATPDKPQKATTYFDVGLDPAALAADRAAVCLYLRRDAEPGTVTGRHLADIRDCFQLDTLEGTLSINTSRTCGVFTPGGDISAGPLNVVTNAPATVWVSSLDEQAVSASSRLLLTHITDIQGKGMTYETPECTKLLKWGAGLVVSKGSADITLSMDSPKSYQVYELDTAGNRMRKLKTSAGVNTLMFTVSTDNPMGQGRIYYEIVKK